MADIGHETTFSTMVKSDITRSEYTTYVLPSELLPEWLAPFEKQIRVFVNGVEMTYLDDRLLERPTTDYWSYGTTAPTAGVRCWGIRYTGDIISESGGLKNRTAYITLYDSDDNQITIDPTWNHSSEPGVNDGWADATFDTRYNIGSFDPPSFEITLTNFPRSMDINRIGWTKATSNNIAESIENLKIEVNVGTPQNPLWIIFGDTALHAVQCRAATAHIAGAELTTDNYPTLQDPVVAEVDDIYFDWTLIHTDPRDLDSPAPVITIEPEPTADTDRVIVMRETRQDQPWQAPTNGSRAHGSDLWEYFEQIRFIAQELCELTTVANWMTLPAGEQEKNDYLTGSQAQFHLNHANAEIFSFADIALLDWVAGGTINPSDQLIVERSPPGGPESWTALTEVNPPTSGVEYEIVGTDIVLGGFTTWDMRIRRNTRKDKYWVDLRSVGGGWNSAYVGHIERQARFMLEEACLLPQFYAEHPLSQSIFPRAWNWFHFVGTRGQWTIPGAVWGGDGRVVVFKNDLLLIEDTDYVIEGFQIVFTTPLIFTDTVTVGVAGSGHRFGFGFGGKLGGGDTGEEMPETTTPSPSVAAPTIDWPGNDLPPDCGFTISLKSIANVDLVSGNWEGGDPLLGYSTVGSTMGTLFTVTNEAQTGFAVGTQQVSYSPPTYCDPEGSNTVLVVASAGHDGDGVWSGSARNPGFGCLLPNGTGWGRAIWDSDCPVSSTSPPDFRLHESLRNITGPIAAGDVNAIPYMRQFNELQALATAAFDAGVTSGDGFTNAQWQAYVDPNVEFTDFDIPIPP